MGEKLKKIVCYSLLFFLILSFSSCASSVQNSDVISSTPPNSFSETQNSQIIPQKSGKTKIKITAGSNVVYGTLYDNEVAYSFINKLPLTLTAFDRIGLVKSTMLSNSLSGKGQLTRAYSKGLIFYWPDGLEVAFCYSDHLPETVVDIIPIGMLDDESGSNLFATYEGIIQIEEYNEQQ